MLYKSAFQYKCSLLLASLEDHFFVLCSPYSRGQQWRSAADAGEIGPVQHVSLAVLSAGHFP